MNDELLSYLAYVTYVGSQLTFVYEHPNTYTLPVADVDLSLSYDQWLSQCHTLKPYFRGRWFEAFRQKFGNSTALLAQACFDHFGGVVRSQAHCVLYANPLYPPRLREISDPPFALNVLGAVSNLQHERLVGVIGSRRATPFSLHQSFEVARYLQIAGDCVVSGGAFGCDIAAHHGVLSTCKKPCAAVVVLAGGLHCFYPRANAQVFTDIISDGGAVLSERLWSSSARSFDFPIRNRIIAGVCEKVLIMQAGMKSGAMLTANHALAFGRDVYVLVHPSGGEAFAGNQKLLLDGALGFDGVENYKYKNFMAIRSVD